MSDNNKDRVEAINNDKNETTRFVGDGQCFKAKLIGILEVSEARGDRMCQEALSDLKMAIRAAGEHKQRITVNIALDGLRLRDEKTGDSLYHHPVHKISFIAQDMTDSRAFGYIFGSPDTGHRFFGIKTDKAASQVVIAMRDLFQVVFALKKKEIEWAKQHLEKNNLFSNISFLDSKGSATEHTKEDSSKSDHKSSSSAAAEAKQGAAVADLVDLELELNSLQQGLHQMERITPSDPFGGKDDPFGDSFTSYAAKPMLPPPPSSGRERSSRVSETSSIFSPRTPNTLGSLDNSDISLFSTKAKRDFKFSRELSSSREEPSSGDWFTPSNSMFDDAPVSGKETNREPTKDEKHELAKQEILAQFDVFTELDPLELKNPPKKVLNELVPANDAATNLAPKNGGLSTDPFGEDPFVTLDPFAEADFKQDPFESEFDSANVNISKSPQTVKHDKFEDKLTNRLHQLHDSMSVDSEKAPEPPPRPMNTLVQIKPPPLPPKKQLNDLMVKPPPRPPHDETFYEYMDTYDTAPSSLEYAKGSSKGDTRGATVEKGPALPAPSRKSKFESDFATAPGRPSKHTSGEESYYLTPISFPEKEASGGLLPPPKKSTNKRMSPTNLTSNISTDHLDLDNLDISLSKLTLSGLNDLALKLNIPSSQLSNMTLVQLTSYLSNVIKAKNAEKPRKRNISVSAECPVFKADFDANFSESNPTSLSSSYDRYAVFRELIDDEVKPENKDNGERDEETPPPKVEEKEHKVTPLQKSNEDRYAALREIVEIELKQTEIIEPQEEQQKSAENINELDREETIIPNIVQVENMFNIKKEKDSLFDYGPIIEQKKTPSVSPKAKSPIPPIITEMLQSNTRLMSGSLSDVISGSSPEIDKSENNDEIKKEISATGEAWAIFDQTNLLEEAEKDKQPIQSEEAASPWSSDSKEYGNGSPSDWRRGDSESDQYPRKRRDQEGWWDTSAEPETAYCPPSIRRSTDSFEEEYYECHDRPRRRRNWSGHAPGGHSSSSRDVSPWEEEPRKREGRPPWTRYPRQPSFERHRERRPTDSWDEEDDYEYDDERRTHRNERHSSRESDRQSTGSREHEGRWEGDWPDDYHHRRRKVDRDVPRDNPRDNRWCCPDRDKVSEKPVHRYGSERGSGRWQPEGHAPKWRHEERYRSRESQESPWEDEYPNEPENAPPPHYHPSKRTSKRPSSASEMDRKTGEIKSRHYLGTGGSDGERDRRYKPSRRSRSRDSQFSEPPHRYKQEPTPSFGGRGSHRSKHSGPKTHFEANFDEMPALKKDPKVEPTSKKSSTLISNKKKELIEEKSNSNTLPTKKSVLKQQGLFENDFIGPAAKQNENKVRCTKFSFDKEEILAKDATIKKQISLEYRNAEIPRPKKYPTKTPKSMFEDDFSPCGKVEPDENNGITMIKEETDNLEESDLFTSNELDVTTNNTRKKILNKNRLTGGMLNRSDLKKSESVNIFSRDNDPFDDDFFCEETGDVQQKFDFDRH